MNHVRNIIAIFLLALLSMCSPRKSREELSHLDASSSDTFIQSLIDNRKDLFADSTNFTIAANTLYSKGQFHIINFTEAMGNDTLAYVILLNPGDPTGIDTTVKSRYTELQDLLKKQTGLTPGILKGRLEPAPDLIQDGSPDFILRYTRNGSEGFQEVMLYNGQNKLTPTSILANTKYTTQNKFTGVNEFIESKDDSTVIVHHVEDSAGIRPIRYDKIWKWSAKEKTWKTGFKALDAGGEQFARFSKRLTYLDISGATFTIPENCQSGGPIYFELQRKTDEYSDYYVIKTGIEDAGYNIIFQIIQKDPSTYILYKARGEKIRVPNPLGEPEINRDSTDATIVIKADLKRKDLYWVTYSYSPTPVPYTEEARLYRFIKCQ